MSINDDIDIGDTAGAVPVVWLHVAPAQGETRAPSPLSQLLQTQAAEEDRTMSDVQTPPHAAQLVTMARALERTLARRRKVVKALTALDDTIRTQRKMLRDLSQPLPEDVYRPLGDDEAP